jgi:fructokinase
MTARNKIKARVSQKPGNGNSSVEGSARRHDQAAAVGTGFIALDLIRSTFDASTTLERRYAGGSCGNVLAILSYLGIHAIAVGRIGNDRAGHELLADLRRWKVDVRLLVTEHDRRTPAVIQETFVDRRGQARHRFLRVCPGCGATMPGYRPLLVADVAQIAHVLPVHNLFFFDRVSPGTLALAQHSRKQGALVIFEPSGIKDEGLFAECLQVAHVFKYSHERLSGLDAFTQRGRVPVEIETRGAEGLRFRVRKSGKGHAWFHLPAQNAPTVNDAVGSGDWCTAGFLMRLMKNENPVVQLDDPAVVSDCLQFGQALAALNCAYFGARGLMYALSCTDAVKAAERILTHRAPKLPQDLSVPTVELRHNHACTVCFSGIRAAYA